MRVIVVLIMLMMSANALAITDQPPTNQPPPPQCCTSFKVPNCLTPHNPPQIIPFFNVKLQPNECISVPYSFGQHTVLYCYEVNLKRGRIAWTRSQKNNQGQNVCANNCVSDTVPLSYFPLVLDNTKYTGRLTDSNGEVGIINNTPDATIWVSCVFGF